MTFQPVCMAKAELYALACRLALQRRPQTWFARTMQQVGQARHDGESSPGFAPFCGYSGGARCRELAPVQAQKRVQSHIVRLCKALQIAVLEDVLDVLVIVFAFGK